MLWACVEVLAPWTMTTPTAAAMRKNAANVSGSQAEAHPCDGGAAGVGGEFGCPTIGACGGAPSALDLILTLFLMSFRLFPGERRH